MQVFAIYGSLILFVVFSLLNVYKSWRDSSLFTQIKFLLFAWFLVLIVFNLIILLLSNEQQLAFLWPYGLFKLPRFSYWALFLQWGCNPPADAAVRSPPIQFRPRIPAYPLKGIQAAL